MKNLTDIKALNEDDYNALLQQTITIIETSRQQIAKNLNKFAISPPLI